MSVTRLISGQIVATRFNKPWIWLLATCIFSLFFVCLLLIVTFTRVSVGSSSSDDLNSLAVEFFRWRQMDWPESMGDDIYDNTVDDFSLMVLETRKSKAEEFFKRLNSISQISLNITETFHYEVLRDHLSTFLDNYMWRFYGPMNPLNFLEGEQVDPGFSLEQTVFRTRLDYENYISTLRLLPEKFQQYKIRFQRAVKYGRTSHRVSVEKVPGQIQALLETDPEMSPYFQPFNRALDGLNISDSARRELRSRGKEAVDDLQDAFRDLKKYIEKEYLPHTRSTYGILGWTNGKENYRACLKWHLSVDLTPEVVHQKGLQEVIRINENIKKIMKKRNFNGTIAEFYQQLSRQPQFHINDTVVLLKRYQDIVYHRIYPQLTRIFNNIPNWNITVVPMPYDGPIGMYVSGPSDGSRPATYQVNLRRPNQINTFSMVALSLHEGVPGHHLQFIYTATANLPEFQRKGDYSHYFEIPYKFPFYTAYTEGWGLYAESLGEYLGIYKDDNELLGRYSWDVFRACRLVVDTGIHYYGWSRDKAIKFMASHTPKPLMEIEIEIDRYITWPGQACAYKIGEMKIRELRDRAKKQLGSKFDIRDFHSVVLENGPVSLSLLEKIINHWIYVTTTGSGSSHQTSGVNVPLIPNIVG